jgi:hypothetical protein
MGAPIGNCNACKTGGFGSKMRSLKVPATKVRTGGMSSQRKQSLLKESRVKLSGLRNPKFADTDLYRWERTPAGPVKILK